MVVYLRRYNPDKPWMKCPFCKHQVYESEYSGGERGDPLVYCIYCHCYTSPITERIKTPEDIEDFLWLDSVNPSRR